MKTRTRLFLLVLGIGLNTSFFYGQCGNSAFETIQANHIQAGFSSSGDFFWDGSKGKFNVPYVPGDAEVSTFFASSLWLSATDDQGNPRLAAQTFGRTQERFDYWSGPIDDFTGMPLNNGCENFDFVWKTNRTDILSLIEDFEDNGQIDEPIPTSIVRWPGKGNNLFEDEMGFSLPNQELAPFFDRNNNGIYEPTNGEYPTISNDLTDVIPGEILWWVYNDVQDNHTQSGGDALGVEIQCTVYSFACLDNEIINDALFAKFKVINKSGEILTDFKSGLWMDANLGCGFDDYVGCDPASNTAFIYNADNIDGQPGSNCVGDVDTYGQNPPVQFITFLNQPLTKFLYSTTMGPVGIQDPNTSTEFINYLNGKWRDGSPLTFGNMGYNLGSTDFVDYLFPDDPNDVDGWSQTSNGDPETNVRPLMLTGTSSLNSLESFELEVAFTYFREPGATSLENIKGLNIAIPVVKDFYDNDFFFTCTPEVICTDDCVYPGDVNADGIARYCDLLSLGVALGNLSDGPKRLFPSDSWIPRFSGNWGLSFANGINYKHADTNGDGMLTSSDIFAIEVNDGQTNPDFTGLNIDPPPFAESDFILEQVKETIPNSGSAIQRLHKTDIILGTVNEPIESIYGIAFQIKYDPTLLEDIQVPLSNWEIEENSFLGNPEDLLQIVKFNQEDGVVEVALTRQNGQNVSGYGKIGRIYLNVRDDVVINNPDGKIPTVWEILELKAIRADESAVNLGVKSNMTYVVDPILGVGFFEKENVSVELIPNPSKGNFRISFSANPLKEWKVYLYDYTGKEILYRDDSIKEIVLPDHRAQGIYLLKILFEDGIIVSQKVVVQ